LSVVPVILDLIFLCLFALLSCDFNIYLKLTG
jgi:hypothetical protein